MLPPLPGNGRTRSTPPPTGDALYSDLRGLAEAIAPVDARGSERLERLADAMVDPAERERWTDVDLRRAFHTERIAHAFAVRHEGGEAPPLVDLMDKIRNVMVLLPILLTWAALAEASRAYARYIAGHPDDVREPFLLLWQKGFGGESSWFSPTFSTVAILDAVIILVIITLTFFAHGRREEHDDAIHATARDFQAHLDNALGDASVRLAVARGNRPNAVAESIERVAGRFDASAQEMLNRLRVEHDRLDAIATRREREFDDFAVFASGMRAGAEESQRVLIDLRQITTGLHTALDDLTSEVSMAGEQQRSLLTVVAGLERAVASSTQSDAALVRQLADAARSLTDTADKAVAGAESAARAGQVASDAVRHIADVAAALGEGQARIEEAIAHESEANTRLAESLRGSAGGVTTATRAMADIVNTLARVRDDLGRLSELTADQAGALHRLLSDQNGMASNLQQVARDLSSVGIATAQRQREITDEAASLIQRIDTLTSVLSRAAAGLPTPEMVQDAVRSAVRQEVGGQDPFELPGGGDRANPTRPARGGIWSHRNEPR